MNECCKIGFSFSYLSFYVSVKTNLQFRNMNAACDVLFNMELAEL